MITYVVSDLFQSPARVLVNAVNVVGVMGKGVAEQFKRCYPDMFEQYRTLCDAGQFTVGQLWLYRTPHKWVMNFPTKSHWRDPSRVEYVEAGLRKFAETYAEQGITSISFPLLGCGAGGLDWPTQVRPLMERYLSPLPVNTYIHLYEPDNPFAVKVTDPDAICAWLNGEPETPAFTQVWDDVTRLILQRGSFTTLDRQLPFQVSFDASERRIAITPPSGDPLLISQSLLSETWHYARAAGFVLGLNLPGGVDARYVLALLAELPYFRPVLWSETDSPDQRQIGLQYVTPVSEVAAP